jgi:hypothetical protein
MRRDPQQLLLEQRERKNREALTQERMGRIHEVKEGQNGEIGVRVVIGGSKQRPWISPWCYPQQQHGGDTERPYYKKGQNVLVSFRGGRPDQPIISHGPPSKKLGVPAHAKDTGLQSKTGQLGKARRSTTKDTIEHWLAEEEEQEQEDQSNGIGDDGIPGLVGNGPGAGGGAKVSQGSQMQGQQQQKKAGKPKMIQRMNEEGGITHRVTEKNRLGITEKGTKIKGGKSGYVVDTDGDIHAITQGKPRVSRPWVLGPRDQIKDDNKYAHQQGGGQNSAPGG